MQNQVATDGMGVLREVRLAANTLLSLYPEDIANNLSDILNESNAEVVTPHHMLEALNRTGLLNSFLEQTTGSANVLLGALEDLHYYLNRKELRYVDATEGSYFTSIIEAADYLRGMHVANQHSLESVGLPDSGKTVAKKIDTISQEEELSDAMKRRLPDMADELFCKAVTDDIKRRGHNNTDLANRIALPRDCQDKLEQHTLERRFHEFIPEQLWQAMQKSSHYKPSIDRFTILSQYIADSLRRDKLENSSTADVDAQIDRYQANERLKNLIGILKSYQNQPSR